jgi:histidinol-phosphate aminotransferase
MRVSRRGFISSAGMTGAAALIPLPLITARGFEATRGGPLPDWPADGRARNRVNSPAAMRLDSNENPNGPGQHALDAIRAAFGEAPRYADLATADLRQAVATAHGVSLDSVLLGCGSGEILRMAVFAFTPGRWLVTAAPSFEDPVRHAEVVGSRVIAVPTNGDLKLDLETMRVQARGAGLVFLCNPNNPTATVHGSAAINDFVARLVRESPETMILIDEAYHEYVEDPGYATSIPLAMANRQVITVRTFSKVFGMAGLRVGYAVGNPETIQAMQRYRLPNSINGLGAAAAVASIGRADHIARERTSNRDAREFTRRAFESAGFKVGRSETNFLMIDIRRDTKEFQAACRAQNILVGRPFPPLHTHARISIGTMDEMRQAVDVFSSVLERKLRG